MEHKIGEIVILSDGRKAEVKAAKSHLFQCSDCVLFLENHCMTIKCHKNERKDHTTIYYKEIKEE